MQNDVPPGNPAHLTCPVPLTYPEHILMAHGGGGRLMNDLIERIFVSAFHNPLLAERHDGAVFPVGDQRLAFTTDAYVVRPLFFPGGDIGTLAVNGTVNDLAMCGARPAFLSAAFILEEGLPCEHLRRVVNSMKTAAQAAGVQLVTGDTKVVDKGKGDGLYITTAGLGVVDTALSIRPAAVRPGDAVLLSGDLGRHGIAIMAVREGLTFQTTLESDCAPLIEPVKTLLDHQIEVHCLRDLTRGGLASALVEIAEASRTRITLREADIPIGEEVQGACEMLGLDPLYVANEGRFIALIAAPDAERALSLLRQHPQGRQASLIGHVAAADRGAVSLRNRLGTHRVIDRLSGEQLPRIC